MNYYFRKTLKRNFSLIAISLFLCLSSCVFSAELSSDSIKAPAKIISMAPNLTEIVFSLGQGEKIAGITDFDHWPPEVNKLPRVGGYYNPNQEVIIQLQPDTIFMLRGRSGLENKLSDMGFKTHLFTCENIQDIITTISEIGVILQAEDQSTTLCNKINKDLKSIKLDAVENLSVMICVGMTPGTLQNIFVAGNKSTHHDLLMAIGCKNTFGNVEKSYFPVNKEALLISRPDIIIDLVPGQPLNEKIKLERIATWKLLPGIPAVQSGKIIILNEDFCNIPGPRIAMAGRLISESIGQLLDDEN